MITVNLIFNLGTEKYNLVNWQGKTANQHANTPDILVPMGIN